MQTWMVLMGLQFLAFLITAIVVIVWMKRPNDRYDDMLAESERKAKEQMKKKS